jgi:hypothetical protein
MHEVAEEDHEQINHFVAVEYRFGVGRLRIDSNLYWLLAKKLSIPPFGTLGTDIWVRIGEFHG